MRQKWIVCFLICVMLLSALNAGAAMRFGTVTPDNVADVTVTKESSNKITVSYPGQKGQQYTVWAIAEAGIDAETGKPTKTSIDNNQGNVIGYMDQKSGGDDGSVEFNVMAGPMLDGAAEGSEYAIFVSTKDGTEDVMERVALFSVEEILEKLGDYNKDGKIDSTDIAAAVDSFMKNLPLTAQEKAALDVDKNGNVDGSDIAKLTDCFMKNLPLE